jgi:hypothetical protein
VLHVVERMGREEDGAAAGRGLAQQRSELLLQQRVESAGRLVEHEQLRPVHERLHEAELLPVPLRELADRTVEDGAEALAECVPQRRVDTSQAGKRVELLLAGQPIGETVSGQVPDTAARLDRRAAHVESEQLRATSGRVDETEKEPDAGRLPRAVRTEKAEHLAPLDTQIKPALAPDLRTSWPARRLDRRRVGHAPILRRSKASAWHRVSRLDRESG